MHGDNGAADQRFWINNDTVACMHMHALLISSNPTKLLNSDKCQLAFEI